MKMPIATEALPNKRAFFIRRSMLTDRLDAEFYHPRHYQLLARMEESGQPINKLRDITSRIVDGPFGSEIKAEDYSDDGVPFLRVADITHGEGVIAKKGLVFISNEAHQRIQRSKVCPGDVVVAKTGATMGAASLIPEGFPEANIRADLAAITLYDQNIAQYLVNYINTGIGYQLFWRLNSGATRGRVVIQNLREYPVILPGSDVRSRVNKAVAEARTRKKEAELKASELLASTDSLLLDLLGVTLTREPPNTLEYRIFHRPLSQVSGNRFDPAANWKKLVFTEGKYRTYKLSDLFALNPRTAMPISNETEVSFVPMDAVSDVYGEIAGHYTRPISESKGYTIFQEGDLIWAKITPCMENGKSAVAENLVNGFAFGSTEFHVFRPNNNDVSIHYLHAMLRLKVVREHARLFFTGSSGHQRVDEQFFHHLEIPCPPLKDQERICRVILDLQEEAKCLFRDADIGLEKAKKEIEAMILSEGDKP